MATHWGRIYRTCSFENIGSKKGEFLQRITQAMKNKGLEEFPDIEPFEYTATLDEALNIFDSTVQTRIGMQFMAGTDVLLGYDLDEVHLRMGLRAERKGENLRFGYFYTGETISPMKSPKGIKFLLLLFGDTILSMVWPLFVGIVLLGKPFAQTHGWLLFWTILLLNFVVAFSPLTHHVYKRVKTARHTIKEIDQMTNEIAESMGGKRITPYKMTKIKLED